MRLLDSRSHTTLKRFLMTIRKLEKPEWRPFLDVVSELLEAKEAEIEVASLNLGAQVLAEGMPLRGISYDPRNDVVEVGK
jgi:Family of unknown function (DUF5335)